MTYTKMKIRAIPSKCVCVSFSLSSYCSQSLNMCNWVNNLYIHTHIRAHTTHICTHGHTHFIVSNDDYTSVSMTVGTFTSERPRQCFNVSITDDDNIERTENFTTRLTLIPDSVTTINASRIIVDPLETAVQIKDNDLSSKL